MSLTADSLEEVRHKFSDAGAAKKWNSMYEADTEYLDESNYRLRRNVAVAQVLARTTPASQVLDLGCGAGPVVSELRRRGVNVIGIDCADDMLAYARERLRALGLDDAGLFLGDCRKTALPSGTIDIVVCLGVISYIEDYDQVLTEIDRLLKPGGTMILSFRNKFRPVFSDPVALGKFAIKALLRPLLGTGATEKYVIGRFLDHRVVTQQIERLGFRFIEFFGIGFGPYCIAGRPLLDEKQSIALSRRLSGLFATLHMRRPQRWLTDVSLWVYQKPAAPACDVPGGH